MSKLPIYVRVNYRSSFDVYYKLAKEKTFNYMIVGSDHSLKNEGGNLRVLNYKDSAYNHILKFSINRPIFKRNNLVLVPRTDSIDYNYPKTVVSGSYELRELKHTLNNCVKQTLVISQFDQICEKSLELYEGETLTGFTFEGLMSYFFNMDNYANLITLGNESIFIHNLEYKLISFNLFKQVVSLLSTIRKVAIENERSVLDVIMFTLNTANNSKYFTLHLPNRERIKVFKSIAKSFDSVSNHEKIVLNNFPRIADQLNEVLLNLSPYNIPAAHHHLIDYTALLDDVKKRYNLMLSDYTLYTFKR